MTLYEKPSLPPGARFNARCSFPDLIPVQDLTDEQEKARAASAVKHKGQWCAQVPHHFETQDPALFKDHMKSQHGRTIVRQIWSGSDNPAPLLAAPVKMWTAPKLTEDGKPFEPKDLEPGATVAWQQDGVERTGQVWSGASYSKSAWVIPHELLEGERAVLLMQTKSGAFAYTESWTEDNVRRMGLGSAA